MVGHLTTVKSGDCQSIHQHAKIFTKEKHVLLLFSRVFNYTSSDCFLSSTRLTY